ncbi:hypothetical protein JXJ21_13845 [candidate division KSB1 bacterium]|nr:hypothetical protein [candidate division KSB1 bacterium]
MQAEDGLSLLVDSIKDDLISLDNIKEKSHESKEQIQTENNYTNRMALALTLHNYDNCI